MIPTERLKQLQYMADNRGYQEHEVLRLTKEGRSIYDSPHGSAIPVSLFELKELLKHYPKEASDG